MVGDSTGSGGVGAAACSAMRASMDADIGCEDLISLKCLYPAEGTRSEKDPPLGSESGHIARDGDLARCEHHAGTRLWSSMGASSSEGDGGVWLMEVQSIKSDGLVRKTHQIPPVSSLRRNSVPGADSVVRVLGDRDDEKTCLLGR
ncbi:hypothetical protein Tco_1376638 [Tanacetum coccineum]